jgi:hypothetical protein
LIAAGKVIMQSPSGVQVPFTLRTQRLGPLPLINHLIQRLGLAPILERCVPVGARPLAISHATILALVLRCLLVEREPVHRVQEATPPSSPRSCWDWVRKSWQIRATAGSGARSLASSRPIAPP